MQEGNLRESATKMGQARELSLSLDTIREKVDIVLIEARS